MLDFFQSQILLYFSLGIVFFLPGYFLLYATQIHKDFSKLEQFVLAFGSSIATIDFLMIVLGRLPLGISRWSLLGAISIFCLVCGTIYKFIVKKVPETVHHEEEKAKSKHSLTVVILLLFLTIFINTIYFKNAIFPTSTDLGHHMYWTKEITTSGALPQYEKAEIGQNFQIEKPTPIADFIIGEHLVFAAVAIIAEANLISAFPILTLFLIHIMSILAIFVLTLSLFKKSPHCETIAVMTLLLIGPLYALASPQAKFASGGVIGNTIGNLFIPLIILVLAKALTKKKAKLLAFTIFMLMALAYTHHLSTFVFIFILFFSIITFSILNYKILLPEIKKWLKLIFTPAVLVTILLSAIFIFAVYTPTYLNTKAIDTAVGSPIKATRTGLTFPELRSTAGEARFAFAVLGIFMLFFARKIGRYNQAITIGWIGALTIMSLQPDWLYVDIPSNRIASYIVFPVSIIAGYMFVKIFAAIKTDNKQFSYMNPLYLLFTFFVLMTFIVTNGLYDNAQALNTSNGSSKAQQTYLASQYLAEKSTASDLILKDHNYLTGDSWMKLAFMRGYNYPLSRGYFKRYEDITKPREQCTYQMISSPNSPVAEQCFNETNTKFIMINPQMDSAQFHRSNQFWQVYTSDEVGIFYKNK